jgi:hypothetical protein
MNTVKDAKVFVESLNEDQRRALANALLIHANGRINGTALATRLCETILLARAVHHITQWKG